MGPRFNSTSLKEIKANIRFLKNVFENGQSKPEYQHDEISGENGGSTQLVYPDRQIVKEYNYRNFCVNINYNATKSYSVQQNPHLSDKMPSRFGANLRTSIH